MLLIDMPPSSGYMMNQSPGYSSKPSWSTKKKLCVAFSLILLAGIITIGVLVPFCIKTPTITVQNTTFKCDAPCTQSSSVTATTYISVYNPNILQPSVYADLSLLTSDKTQKIWRWIDSLHCGEQTDNNTINRDIYITTISGDI